MKDSRFLALEGLRYIQHALEEDLMNLVMPERYRDLDNCIPSLYKSKELVDMGVNFCKENINRELRLVCIGFRSLRRMWSRVLTDYESPGDFERTFHIVLNSPNRSVCNFACLCGFLFVYAWEKPVLTAYSVTKPKNALVHGNFDFLEETVV